MTPLDLVEQLDRRGLSSRAFARILDVSPMWVSRRTTGQTPITDEDAAAIRRALDTVPAPRPADTPERITR